MADVNQPRHSVDGLAETAIVAGLHCAGVERHPDPDGRLVGPRLCCQGQLRRNDRCDRIPGAGKCRSECVAYGLEDVAA